MNTSQILVTGTCVTGVTSAVLAAIDSHALTSVYLPSCAVVYTVAGVLALAVRVRRANAGDSPEALPADLTDDGSDEVCDSCGKLPPVRMILVQGDPFAVCSGCTPPTADGPTPGQPFVPQVVR